MPTTTASAGTTSPPARRTPSSVRPSMNTPQRTSTPSGAMEIGDGLAHLGAEAADQRRTGAFEDDDVVAERLGGGSGLEPDEAGADHDDATAAVGDLAAQTKRVVEGAQFVDVIERVLAREPAGMCAGCDHQAVEAEYGAVGEGELARSDVELGGRVAEAPLDIEVVEHVGLAKVDPVGLPLARQELLRQRRPIVRAMHFVADHDDRCSRRRAGGASLRHGGRRATLRRRRPVRADRGHRGVGVGHVRHDATRRAPDGKPSRPEAVSSAVASGPCPPLPILRARPRHCRRPKPSTR